MKRLGVATACSLLLHAGLFWIGSGWFLSRAVTPPVPGPVTVVTMSCRQEQEGAGRAESGPRAAPAPSRPGQHRPAVKKASKPRSAQPPEQRIVPWTELGNAQDAGQENAFAAAGQQGAVRDSDGSGSGMGVGSGTGSGSGRGSEAVPLYKINPPPRYPESARRRGVQGTVVLSVHVDARGRASNLWLFTSSGHRSLDNAALQAVKDWIFEPGTQGGLPVAMWVKVPVRFELK